MNSRQDRREEWSRMVGLQEKSGQSVRLFCKERGLSEASFYSWRQRLQRKDKPVTFALWIQRLRRRKRASRFS